jgi:mono/diheme cytochrome c family protein
MLAAGVLTATPPATSSMEAQRRLGFLESIETDQVRLTLRVAPMQVGDNEFAVDIVDRRPGADAIKPEVLLRMGVSGGGLGLNQVEAVPTGAGRYTARGTFITLPGQWEVDVILRRPNYDDVVHRFTLDVGTRSPLTLSQEDQTPNPVQPDARSIAAGKELYTTNCVPCHGVTGLGDGPVGLTLNPRPADLTVHTEPGVHTDGQLYKWISEGYPGSTMPEFNKYLSETERWDIVNYIRTLARPAP